MEDENDKVGAFDPDIPEEGASTPPPGWLHNIHGYQGHGRAEGDLYPPPPAYTPQPEVNRNTLVPDVRVPKVSEDQAREALLRFVESRWRYSSKPARNLAFRQLQAITVYRYRLETYTETRTSSWQFEVYNGQPVDGAEFGVSPPPWEIPVPPPQIFTDRVETLRVPHSSIVKVCHMCSGCGRVRCRDCSGRGNKHCILCHGRGHRRIPGNHKRASKTRICTSCHGRGRKRCSFCQGRGFKTCSACQGSQNLVHYIQLTVTWKNNVSVFIPDRQPDFPDQNFEKVSGEPFFLDENTLVYPLQGFPDLELCDASARMIHEHLERFSSTSRILQQASTIGVQLVSQMHPSENL
ncbi:protein SSUH2 homolog isoform X2 [Takifugu rubripes]|uniref:protein SSUH2 homolog isoform X2 n=1 Tax=Takifugu rubripes TaxID=31033 RepID=UPI001145225A|nr:protein SSUH2 homolog isoform X2 [Takifugu rubripes]